MISFLFHLQDSLRKVLYPYKHNIIPVVSDTQPLGHQQKPSATDEEIQVWSHVDDLANAYQEIVDEYKQRYAVYNQLIDQYGLGDDAEFGEYGNTMREKYTRLIKSLKVEERENLQKLYDLYYQKYLSLLTSYRSPDKGTKLGLNMLSDWEEDKNEDWEGLYKMQQLKEYLQVKRK